MSNAFDMTGAKPVFDMTGATPAAVKVDTFDANTFSNEGAWREGLPSGVLSLLDEMEGKTAFKRWKNSQYMSELSGVPFDTIYDDYESQSPAHGWTGNAEADFEQISAKILAAPKYGKGRRGASKKNPLSAYKDFLDYGLHKPPPTMSDIKERVIHGPMASSLSGLINAWGTSANLIRKSLDMEYNPVLVDLADNLREESKRAKGAIELNPRFKETMGGTLVNGALDLPWFMASSVVPLAGLSRASKVAQVAGSSTSIFGTMYDSNLDDYRGSVPVEEQSPEEEFLFAFTSSLSQTVLERIFPARIFSKFGSKSPISKKALDVFTTGQMEGATEASQGFIQDALAAGIFDDTRELTTWNALGKRLEEYAAGAILGSSVSLVTNAVSPTAASKNLGFNHDVLTPNEWAKQRDLVTDDQVMSAFKDQPALGERYIRALNQDVDAQNAINQEVTDPLSFFDTRAQEEGVGLYGEPVELSGTDTPTQAEIEPIGGLERVARTIEDVSGSVDKGMQKFVSLSTRIKDISPATKLRVEKIDQQEVKLMNKGTKQTDPFIESVNRRLRKLKGTAKDQVMADIMNGKFDKLKDLGVAGVGNVRQMLDERAKRVPNINFLENYFPRKVKDLEGLLEHLAAKKKGVFESAMAEAEAKKGKPLTKNERMKVVSSVLKSPNGQGVGFKKKRSILEVTPDMVKFYEDPLVTLRIYNHKTSELISKAEFLGEQPIDSELFEDGESDISDVAVAEYIEREAGDLSPKEQAELKTLLSSRLKFSRGGRWIDRMISTYRTAVALKYVSGLKTLMMQTADLSVIAYESQLASLGSKVQYKNEFGENVKASLDNIGVESIDQELREALKTKAGVSQFILAPLRAVDFRMKGLLLDSISKKWERSVKADPEGLKQELRQYFGEEQFADSVFNSIKNKKMTPDLQFAFYVKMSEYHPTGVSQHTKFYIDNPEMRGLFVLKSFAFKRLDLVYRESLKDINAGLANSTAAALRGDAAGVRGGAAQVGSGILNAFKILAMMYGTETLLEALYYEITPNQTDDDYKFIDLYVENILQIFPFFSLWDFKRGIERGDLWEAAVDSVEPPSPIGASTLGEFVESMVEGEEVDYEQVKKDIPFFGALLKED